MRTTLHIDDDAYKIVVRYAKDRRIGVGKAVSELVAKAASEKLRTRYVNGFHVFDLPEDSPVVTTEMVRQIMDEEGI